MGLYCFSRRTCVARATRRPFAVCGRRGAYQAIACLLVAAPAFAQEQAAPDCEPRPVHFDTHGQLLTRTEKIELMDKALDDSLARFEECQTAIDAAESSADGSAGGSSADGSAAGSSADGSASGSSAGSNAAGTSDQAGAGEADALMGGELMDDELMDADEAGAGEHAAVDSVGARGIRGTGPAEPEQGAEDTDAAAATTATTGSGKPPEDIPDVDNDDAIARQIRLAAMAETDPVLKARLWNEYRRYKGLPTKPVAGEEVPADEVATE